MKISLILFCLNITVLYSSEITMNDHGIVVRIDDISIDYYKVGVLKYDYEIPDENKKIIIEYLDKLSTDNKRQKYFIVGAKKINDCIIISCGQEKTADGGTDIVYSIISKKIIGHYCGGARG